MLGNPAYQRAFVEWMSIPSQRDPFRRRFVWPIRMKIALGGVLQEFKEEIESEMKMRVDGLAQTKLSTAIQNIVLDVHKKGICSEMSARCSMLDEWDSFIVAAEL